MCPCAPEPLSSVCALCVLRLLFSFNFRSFIFHSSTRFAWQTTGSNSIIRKSSTTEKKSLQKKAIYSEVWLKIKNVRFVEEKKIQFNPKICCVLEELSEFCGRAHTHTQIHSSSKAERNCGVTQEKKVHSNFFWWSEKKNLWCLKEKKIWCSLNHVNQRIVSIFCQNRSISIFEWEKSTRKPRKEWEQIDESWKMTGS